MTWVPLVITVIRYVLLILEALANPDSVVMSVQTVDGRWQTFPCKVTRKGSYQAKITANYQSTGVPVTKSIITIGGVPFAKAHINEGSKLYAAGPVELGGDF